MSNVANNRTVASCIVNGNTHIPLRRSTSKTSGNDAASNKVNKEETNKWKMKFEESETKRKALIAQNEKSELIPISY